MRGDRESIRLVSVLTAAVVLMAALAVAGSSSARSMFGRLDPFAGVEPDVMHIGFTQEPDSLNPFNAVLSASYSMFARVYDLLVGIGKDYEPVPQLAKDWSVAADNITWTFNLHDNVKWHDGTPFTADDVKFTIDYIQTCELSLFLGYVGNPATDPVYIEAVTAMSPTQVVITTNVPKANMLSMFVFIVPEHIWSGIACNQAEQVPNDPPIGTGLYKFNSWVQGAGGYLLLDLNTDYHLIPGVMEQKPDFDFVDQIYMRFYVDPLPLYNDFQAGDLDATDALTSRQFVELNPNLPSDPDPDPDVGKFVYPQIALSEIGFCVATDQVINDFRLPPPQGKRHWLMTNLTLRQAVAYAMDRQSIIDNAYQGLGEKGESLIPSATSFWHYDVPDADEAKFDLARAADLLSDPAGDGWTLKAGATTPGMKGENLDPAAANNQDAFADVDANGIREVIDSSRVYDDIDQNGVTDAAPKGNEGLGSSASELEFGVWIIDYATEQQTSADIFIPWLAQIGISVQKVIVSEGQMIAVSYACDYDLYMWGWGGDVDPDFMLSVMTTDQILGWQDAWYSNPDFDAMYLEQQGHVDLLERQAVVHEMQKIVYAHHPYIVYTYPYGTTAVRIDRFTGWGDWTTDPGLGLTGFGNAFLMLQLEPVSGAANQCPTVPALMGPSQVYAGDSATFAASSSDAEGDPLNWTFDWGDASVTWVETGAGVAGATASHAWSAIGSYDVKVIVDDRLCGQSVASSVRQVTVETPPAEVGWIAGTVTDASTQDTIEGALVSVGAQSDATTADGTYNLTLAPGSYTVTVSKDLHVTQTRSVTVSVGTTSTEDFALESNRGWIAGRVTEEGTTTAVAGALVEVRSGTTAVTSTTTNTTGGYNVTVAPGTYTVNGSATGFTQASQSGVNVQLGETTTVNLTLTRITGPSGLSPLAVGGVSVVVLALIGIVAAVMLRRRKKQEEMPMPPPPPPQP